MGPSARLVFEKLTDEDIDLSISMSMDEAIMKYISGKALNKKEALKRFEYQLNVNQKYPNLGFYKAIEETSLSVTGYLKILKTAENIMEIGYAVLPTFRGKGFAREMTETMIAYTIRQFPEVSKLFGTVDKQNPASAHILKSYGFSIEKEELSEGRNILHFTKEI